MKIKKIKWTVLLSVFLLAVMLFSFLPLSNNKILSHAQSNESFTVEVYGRDGSRLLEGSSVSYDTGIGYVFNWKDVNKFVFNINPSSLNVPPRYDANSQRYYNVSININYVRGYRESAQWNAEFRVTFENLEQYSTTKHGDNGLDELATYRPEFLIDEGITTTTTTGVQASAKEWGIYQFTLAINGQNTVSDFFIIEPTRDVFNAPETKMTVTSSESSLRNAYLFTLENEDEYKYIDSNKLVWYAKGEAVDGTKYALVEMDIGVGDFNDCTAALFGNEKQRSGLTFTFEDQGKYGQWEIWCVYKAEGASVEQVSNRTQIETKQNVSYSWIFYVVGAVCAVAIAVSVGICVYKMKRERVY